MIVWHVTTAKKLNRYRASGGILPPVRAWENASGGTFFKTDGTQSYFEA